MEQASVQLQLTATAPTAACPRCAGSSSSIHSRYQRHLTDLPWGACTVRLQLRVRKFVCRNPHCERRIFTERLPEFVASYARKTRRLLTVLRTIGVALGGNAGARLAARLRLPTSPATLLRLVQTAPVPPIQALQAVGVDEWAWRRGHRYGTILVNLADHDVVDLLPDRSAATVAAWLAQYSTITVVCRDRSDLYADGIRRGAPEAVQVVDRFHFVRNLRQALEAVLLDHRPALQAAALGTAMAFTPPPGLMPGTPIYQGRRLSLKPAPPPDERPPRYARWVAIYEAVRTLRARGTPIATIARQLGISRPTVYAYLRRAADMRQPPESQRSPYTRFQGPSAQAVSFVMVGQAAKRSHEAQTYLDQLCHMDADIARHMDWRKAFLPWSGGAGGLTWRHGGRKQSPAASTHWPVSPAGCRMTSSPFKLGSPWSGATG
jgi:Transposase/Helix-turn-helix domain of resolvase/zinc-finger of transposase IS204/IS1001/IS1096/IS1165